MNDVSQALRQLIAERAKRERHFPGLSDTAWEMLLDLALSAQTGRRVCVTSLCLAAYAPATTGLRHISLLAGEGLIERHADPDDARRVFVKLTRLAGERLGEYLGLLPFQPRSEPRLGSLAGSGTFEMSPPLHACEDV